MVATEMDGDSLPIRKSPAKKGIVVNELATCLIIFCNLAVACVQKKAQEPGTIPPIASRRQEDHASSCDVVPDPGLLLLRFTQCS